MATISKIPITKMEVLPDGTYREAETQNVLVSDWIDMPTSLKVVHLSRAAKDQIENQSGQTAEEFFGCRIEVMG